MRSLGKTPLAFALLHSVFQGQICLLLQVFLDFLLLHSSATEQRMGLGPRRGAVGTVDGWEEVEMRLQRPPWDRGRWLFIDSSLQVIYTRNVLLEERILPISEQRISVGKEQIVHIEVTPKISNLSLL